MSGYEAEDTGYYDGYTGCFVSLVGRESGEERRVTRDRVRDNRDRVSIVDDDKFLSVD